MTSIKFQFLPNVQQQVFSDWFLALPLMIYISQVHKCETVETIK